MNDELKSGAGKGAASAKTVVISAAVAAVLAFILTWYFWPRSEVEPVPSPAQVSDPTVEPPPLEIVEPAKTAEERGDTAREVIADLKANAQGSTPDYAQAYARAQAFAAGERYADAHLLNFYAARGGFGPAAFDLGRSYDPNHFQADHGLMDKPDALQAYRWYQQAVAAGVDGAADHLAQLRVWAEQAAGSGDNEAERLLLQWE